MIKYKENPENNIVEISVDGKITEADFERITSQLKAGIQKHGKLRILEEVHHNDIDSMMLLTFIIDHLSCDHLSRSSLLGV